MSHFASTAVIAPARTPATSVSTRERHAAISTWLLSAARDPWAAREDWARRGVTVLECGGIMAAVRIPAELVHAAADSTEPAQVNDHLRHALHRGPVIADIYAQLYYALVPAVTASLWPRREYHGTKCLGRESYLGVPAVDRTEGSPGRTYWSVPPCEVGSLCDPYAVAASVRECLRAHTGAEQ